MFSFLQKFLQKKLVSIIISNKNSLPLLRSTIESLKQQTYKNIEVIIIDGKSTDGSLEFIEEQKKYLNLKITSEIDSGISEAYSKGLNQASGDIVGILAADERYYPHTVKTAVKWFKKYPNNIVCGGMCKFLNKDEIEVDQYLDDYLDLERHLTCEHICAILPSFFNKKLLGNNLFYKTSHKTCPDYDFWARLALRYPKDKFKWLPFPITKALRTDDSMSFRDSGFKGMVRDKIAYLKEFLAENIDNEKLKSISFNRCAAGIHMWAAEQIAYIKYDSEEIIYHCNQAYLLDKTYERIKHFLDKNDFALTNPDSADFKISRYFNPSCALETVSNLFEINIFPKSGSKQISSNPLQILTSDSAWGYAGEISFSQDLRDLISNDYGQNIYWVSFLVSVNQGTIGIGKAKNNEIIAEKIISKNEWQKLYFQINEKCFDYNFIIRSGGEANSLLTIHAIELHKELRS